MSDMVVEGAVPESRLRWTRWLSSVCRLRLPNSILALITAVFVFRLLMAIAVIPPWQGPDEPQHLAFVRILALQPSSDLEQRESVVIESEILRSMADYDWWKHYGELRPNPIPEDFSPLADHIWRVETAPPVYYLLAAAYLKIFHITELIDQYHALRWMSAFLAVLMLWCAWAGSNLLFGQYVATGSTALLALDPQIALVSISVNPAVLVNLLGAIIWWQAARLMKRDAMLLPVVAIVSIAGIAIFTKRVAASFVGMAALAAVFACGRAGLLRRRRLLWLVVAIGVVILGGAGLARLIPAELARLREHWGYLLTFSINDRARSLEFFSYFTTGLFDSAWLWAGWLRYPAPLVWLLTLRGLTVVGMAGLLLFVVSVHSWRRGIAAAGALVLVQITAIYVGLYLNGYGPQGHYLFPVMAPWMTMLWIGLHGWWPRNLWPVVGTAVLATMFVLDVIAWSVVIVPAYLG